mmetsp:Transcript_6333/g.25485  ORF Transcript_6333/g.25485 Transcript_6333/m.25485 type:complete len:300 (-) Transcript_6333:582-1481(-)
MLRASSARNLCMFCEQCLEMDLPPWPSKTAYMWYAVSPSQAAVLTPPGSPSSSGWPFPSVNAGGSCAWSPPSDPESPSVMPSTEDVCDERTQKTPGTSATASSFAARRPWSHAAPARGAAGFVMRGGADCRRAMKRHARSSSLGSDACDWSGSCCHCSRCGRCSSRRWRPCSEAYRFGGGGDALPRIPCRPDERTTRRAAACVVRTAAAPHDGAAAAAPPSPPSPSSPPSPPSPPVGAGAAVEPESSSTGGGGSGGAAAGGHSQSGRSLVSFSGVPSCPGGERSGRHSWYLSCPHTSPV